MAEQETLTVTPDPTTPETPAVAALAAMDAAGAAVTEETEQVEGEQAEGSEGVEEVEEFEVEIVHPSRGEEGPPEKSKLVVPDQKTADALRFAQNAVAKIPKLESQLAEAQQSVAILDALDKDPVAAMQLLSNDPKVSQEFGQNYVREHYRQVAGILAEMGLKVTLMEGTTERTLELESRDAKRDRETRLEKSRAASQTTTLQSAFESRARQVVEGLAQTMAFADAEDKDLFYRASSDKLGKLYHTNPHASPAEQTAALQGLVQKFAGKTTATIKTKVIRDEEGRFKAAKEMNGKMRKVAGGQSGLAPALPSFDPNESLESFTRRLEGRK